jgi:hypothetical protein
VRGQKSLRRGTFDPARGRSRGYGMADAGRIPQGRGDAARKPHTTQSGSARSRIGIPLHNAARQYGWHAAAAAHRSPRRQRRERGSERVGGHHEDRNHRGREHRRHAGPAMACGRPRGGVRLPVRIGHRARRCAGPADRRCRHRRRRGRAGGAGRGGHRGGGGARRGAGGKGRDRRGEPHRPSRK